MKLNSNGVGQPIRLRLELKDSSSPGSATKTISGRPEGSTGLVRGPSSKVLPPLDRITRFEESERSSKSDRRLLVAPKVISSLPIRKPPPSYSSGATGKDTAGAVTS